jgi:hypothetical protein
MMLSGGTPRMTLYHCPDCDRVHDDPFEAAFTLFARCIDCGTGAEFREDRLIPIEVLEAA